MRRSCYPRPAWRRWLILLPVLGCLSCSKGPGYNSVQGKVLYKNEPIEGVVVTFHPKRADIYTIMPVGQTGDDGKFSLTTGKNAGAAAGEYDVTFSWPGGLEDQGKAKPRKMIMKGINLEDRFKGAYSNPAKAPFKVEVKNGKNVLEPFNLE